jgi:hypothetical protein
MISEQCQQRWSNPHLCMQTGMQGWSCANTHRIVVIVTWRGCHDRCQCSALRRKHAVLPPKARRQTRVRRCDGGTKHDVNPIHQLFVLRARARQSGVRGRDSRRRSGLALVQAVEARCKLIRRSGLCTRVNDLWVKTLQCGVWFERVGADIGSQASSCTFSFLF